MTTPRISSFFDAQTNTFSYVVAEEEGRSCAIIDSVLDFDYASGRVSYQAAQAIIDHVEREKLDVEWLLETHVHADHLSAAPYLQERLGGKIGIGAGIVEVQETFGKIFNENTRFQRDGSQFDRLFNDGDALSIGAMSGYALHTPGHTPACMTYIFGDAAFIGDTLFMPDAGTARADFPGGDARILFRSIRKVLALPLWTRLFMCHDYGPNGRDIRNETTVAEQRMHNVHVCDGVTEDEFVALRQSRDATLAMPRLIIPSLQVNMKAGALPEPEEDGRRYLKVPLNGL
ncbi:MBL fold metallo-hydrolase [Consotaella salsifontis]|uniref:Glyoxylase, beta-lactamase superfamily II n=1 Tax=Consotaella salsifontis TaxID=1365950 RepID=A0A1T4TC77_9HYPH|nr:MBL fold metallo-hydrolase [Consotaella salsifontis]SKA37996.1 Glyoxylase, beta-lactamase superfamily II [Consotaella salsifontis]